MMKTKVSQLAVMGMVAVAMTAAAVADQISVPNQFIAGTTARASEVNQNFQALVQESNAQDLRIQALETSNAFLMNQDQLLCRPSSQWLFRADEVSSCYRTTEPYVTQRLAFSEVMAMDVVLVEASDDYFRFVFKTE